MGRSASVTHSIPGPPSKQIGCSASARLRVTCGFEFGLTTKIFLRRCMFGSLSRPQYYRKVRRIKAFNAFSIFLQSLEQPLSDPVYDLVIRGGTVATSSDVFAADVGITGETIVALGSSLAAGK